MTEHEWLSSDNPQQMLAYLRERGLATKVMLGYAAEEHHKILGVGGEVRYDPERFLRIDARVFPAIKGHVLSGERQAAIIRDIFGNPFRQVEWFPEELTLADNFVLAQRKKDGLQLLDRSILTWNDGTVVKLAQAIAGGTCEECRYGTIRGNRCGQCHGTGKTPPDWSKMPILADALEEAGCANEEILAHCRGMERCPRCEFDCDGQTVAVSGTIIELEKDWGFPEKPFQKTAYIPNCKHCHGTGLVPLRGPHVAGCWVLRLILGGER